MGVGVVPATATAILRAGAKPAAPAVTVAAAASTVSTAAGPSGCSPASSFEEDVFRMRNGFTDMEAVRMVDGGGCVIGRGKASIR